MQIAKIVVTQNITFSLAAVEKNELHCKGDFYMRGLKEETNTKSSTPRMIRFKPGVYEYVSNQPGENFNDKFNKLIKRIQEEEPERKEQIKELDKKIAQKEKGLNRISALVSSIDSIESSVETIKRTLKSLENEVNTVKRKVKEVSTL